MFIRMRDIYVSLCEVSVFCTIAVGIPVYCTGSARVLQKIKKKKRVWVAIV